MLYRREAGSYFQNFVFEMAASGNVLGLFMQSYVSVLNRSDN
jgi:hypothetical protein